MTSRVDYGEQVNLLGGGSGGLTINSSGQVLVDNVGSPELASTADTDTGFNWLAGDIMRFIAGGILVAQLDNSGANQQFNIGGTGSNALPSIANTGDTDTGIRWPVPGNISFVGEGVEVFRLNASTSGQEALTFALDGTASTPVLSRQTDLDTGIFFQAADSLSLAAGGVEMLRLTESTSDQIFIGPDGTETAPALSFVNDPDTGFFDLLGDTIQITCAGSEVARFTTAGIETAVVGTAAAPSITLATDDNTGIFFQATTSDQISMTAGGVELLRLSEGDAIQSFLKSSGAVSADTAGGELLLESGDGNGTGNGGNITLNAGTGGTSVGGGGGAISINGGNAGAGSATSGGNANFIAGDGDGSGAGGAAFIGGGDGGATNADGGDASIAGGDATGTGTGGDVGLYTGATGTGEDGDVVFFTGGFPSGEEFARFRGATTTTAATGTPTTILSIPTLTNRSYSFEIFGLGREDDGTPTGETLTKRIFGGAENTGGSLTLLSTIEDRSDTAVAADWDITVSTSGTDIIIQVDDGGAETVDWKVHVKLIDHT